MMADQTDIFDACRRGDVELVEKIYERNPDIIHVEDFKGFTPLIIAVYNNQPAVVDFLLSKGARAEMQDQAGNTALMGVCFRGYIDIAKKLLDVGAEVNQRNYQGATALTFAATFGHLEIAELLLQKGADMTIPDSRGKSAFDHAIIQENEDMIKLLQRYQEADHDNQ
ncbi:ankyrin repeat domain-containing protein [Aridibaculum aurantiacum]|uniref:ankyrin repeat domain-containing protein n=1 Tax=Aridibaculum aurantiacum TaxID=2810307 RepID=UPI001A966EA3|nr:ankyrin repeat domain-containing protein [Aridibaculum aurantiacum]